MNKYILKKNREYALHYDDPETGYGILYSEKKDKVLYLNPLSMMIWNSDGTFIDLDSILARDQLAGMGTVSREDLIDLVSSMKKNGILLGENSHDNEVVRLSTDSDTTLNNDLPVLESLYFYSTKKCNARCFHCYQPTNYVRGKYVSGKSEGVSGEEIVSIVNEAIPLGLKTVKITGGEPLLRDDMCDIISKIRKTGVRISLETNGSMIDEKVADILTECKVNVAISLDGATAETHDKFRNFPGSFDKVLHSLELLSSRGGNVKTIMSLSRRNFHEIEDVILKIKSKGCNCIKFNPVSTLGIADRLKEKKVLLDVNQLLGLCAKRNDLEQIYEIIIFIEAPPAFSTFYEILKGRIGICNFKTILGVLHDGSISYCGVGNVHKELVFGNIRDKNFNIKKFWRDSSVLRNTRSILNDKIAGICSNCIHESFCHGSCRALAYEESGTFLSPHVWCQRAFEKKLFPCHYQKKGGKETYQRKARVKNHNQTYQRK